MKKTHYGEIGYRTACGVLHGANKTMDISLVDCKKCLETKKAKKKKDS
jgi:hypothetical protein